MHTRGTGMQPVFPHPDGGFIHIVHHVIHNPLLFGRLPLCITRPRRWTCRAKNCIILHTPFFAQSGGGWRGGAGAPAGPCARLRGWPGFPMEGGSVRPKRAPRRPPRPAPPPRPRPAARKESAAPPAPRRAPAPPRPAPLPRSSAVRAPAAPPAAPPPRRAQRERRAACRATRRALLPRCAQRERRSARRPLPAALLRCARPRRSARRALPRRAACPLGFSPAPCAASRRAAG